MMELIPEPTGMNLACEEEGMLVTNWEASKNVNSAVLTTCPHGKICVCSYEQGWDIAIVATAKPSNMEDIDMEFSNFQGGDRSRLAPVDPRVTPGLRPVFNGRCYTQPGVSFSQLLIYGEATACAISVRQLNFTRYLVSQMAQICKIIIRTI
jgi:hypothetical protein